MGRPSAASVVVLVLGSILLAGCSGNGQAPPGSVDNETAEQSAADLIAQLLAEEEAAANGSAPANEMPTYPDAFLLNKTELPYEFQLANLGDIGGADIAQGFNPGRVDAVVASVFMRPVAAEAWWTVASLRASPTTFLTIQSLRWASLSDTNDALAKIGNAGDATAPRCHWPGSPNDLIRGLYQNGTVVVWIGFDPAHYEYAKLLVQALREYSDLKQVCPLSYSADVVSDLTAPKIAWTMSESTDKMQVTQPPPSGRKWSTISVDTTADVFVRIVPASPTTAIPISYPILVTADGVTALSAYGPPNPNSTYNRVIDTEIKHNDVIELCAVTGLANVQVKILADNKLSMRYTFAVVDSKTWC